MCRLVGIIYVGLVLCIVGKKKITKMETLYCHFVATCMWCYANPIFLLGLRARGWLLELFCRVRREEIQEKTGSSCICSGFIVDSCLFTRWFRLSFQFIKLQAFGGCIKPKDFGALFAPN